SGNALAQKSFVNSTEKSRVRSPYVISAETARLEKGQGAQVEVHVAEIDLVADHHFAARLQDSPLQRPAVVRLLLVQPAHPWKRRRQLFQELQGPVAGSVLRQDQLVLPAQIVELAA